MAMNQGGNGWGAMTRTDLRDFDSYATTAVLTAVERGGVARRSSNGHIILRAADGRTMSVSRSSKKSKHVVRQQLERLFPAPPPPPKEKRVSTVIAPTDTNAPRPAAWVACPAKGCALAFPTEGARYSHVEREHVKCTEPGCDAVSINERGSVTHRRLAHEGWKPRQGTGRKEASVPEATGDAVTDAAPAPGTPTPPQDREPQVTDAARLQGIRNLLGPDPRIGELETEVAKLRRQLADQRQRANDAEARLALMREALEA